MLVAAAPEGEAAKALAFADALLAEGDYYRAIGEYKRFLFLWPDAPEATAARFSIGLAYLRGGQPEAALAHYRSLYERYRETLETASLAEEASLQMGYARYVSGDALGARLHLSRWLHQTRLPPAHASVQRATYLLGWSRLSLLEPGAAQTFESLDLEWRPALIEAAKSLNRLPYRSPLLAALLSVVPGGGHLYLGQAGIALAALAWNALFAYGAFDAVRRGDVGVAVVLGVFEAIWYLGTIFGAVSGAHKFNRDAQLNALEELRARFDDRPESWPPSPPLSRSSAGGH